MKSTRHDARCVVAFKGNVMSKRRKKQMYEVAKRCHCTDRNACDHAWWLRVFAKGKRQRINLTELYSLTMPATKADVQPWAAQAQHDARKGLIVAGQRPVSSQDARLTLADVVERYVAARGGHRHYYLDGLRATEVPAANGGRARMEKKPIDAVTTADIREAIRVWRARKRTKNGVRGGVVAERHMIASARHLFSWSVKQGLVAASPLYSAQGKPLISIVTKGQGRHRRLEPGEEQRIKDAADPFTADFFAAMLETGCRPGELRTLQWLDVHDDHFVVTAAKAKDREDRFIPITPDLRKILDGRRKGPDGNDLPDTAYAFGNETGDLVTTRRLCTLWNATLEKAKVVDLHLHDLRREFASQLSETNVPLAQVRDALGHSNVTMTSRYLGISREGVRSAYDKLAAARAARRSAD